MFADLPPQLPLHQPLMVQISSGVPAQVTCPTGQSTQIDVRWNSTPIRYDFSKSSDELAKLPLDTKNPYGTHVHTDRGGLANGEIQISSSIGTQMQTYPSLNLTCQWINRVNVEIGIKQTVYIAREYKPGTCKHKAVLGHEIKHVKTDQRVVQDYVPLIKKAVVEAVTKIGVVGPKPSSETKTVQQKMNTYLREALMKQNNLMNADRRVRQQKIDSLEEYNRVSKLCDTGQ